MKLTDLMKYNEIVIQCHDNPDADAIGSGFALYRFYKQLGKRVRFIYGGRFIINKSNLRLLVDELDIPIEHVTELDHEPELLLMTDCQYDGGNVQKFAAKEVAVIDHHQVITELPALSEVRSNIGSACTIVWDMLRNASVDVNLDDDVTTALYYGLYTDTNNFAEIHHPLDKDARDALWFNKSLVARLRNANLSLDELKIAGVAMLGYEYYEDHRYAIIQTDPCDPNILGLISDFCLSVDNIDVVLVYSVLDNGIKFSVRSCSMEAHANEVAEFLAHGIGGGGGHLEKAGGFLQSQLLEKEYPKCKDASKNQLKHVYTEILRHRMDDFFQSYDVIYAGKDKVDTKTMQIYQKVPVHVGYIKTTDVGRPGDMLRIRTLEGDVEMSCRDDLYIMIGVKGEVYPMYKEKFDVSYVAEDEPFEIGDLEYTPNVHNAMTGEVIKLLPYAKTCVSTGTVCIFAKKLDRVTKVFTTWDPGNYMYATPDDYLAVRVDDPDDVYIIDQDIFPRSYKLSNVVS